MDLRSFLGFNKKSKSDYIADEDLLEKSERRTGFHKKLSRYENNQMTNYLNSFPIFKNYKAIFMDNHSNYILQYTDGPMTGCISLLDHEDNNPVPGFRCLERLENEMMKNPNTEWYDFQLDYPSQNILDNELEDDRKIISEIKKVIKSDLEIDEEYKSHLIKCIIRLTPVKDIDSIYAYLCNDDMYVQEQAVNYFKYYNYTQAAPALFEIAKNGLPNGQIQAILTLQQFNTEESIKYLDDLRQILPIKYHRYFNTNFI